MNDKTTNNQSNDFPVDAVITWVDGMDPVHKAKLDAYLSEIGGERPRSASSARFHNSGEIEFCVTSLLRFAPWIRTIFIVTDEQQPDLIKTLKNTAYEHRVVIVDHKEIFAGYESCLPTFNIRSILTVLWKVPGLAEHFIFLNDDFSLLRPVKKEDFFRDGKVVIRGKWVAFTDKRLLQRLKTFARKWFGRDVPQEKQRVKHLAAQEYSAKLAGFTDRYYQLEHNPHPWRRSTTEAFFAEHPELFQKNIQYRLRSADQFITECLAAQLEIKNGQAILDNQLATLQLKPAEQAIQRLKQKISSADRNKKYVFVCVQNIEQSIVAAQKTIMSWLEARVGKLTDFIYASRKDSHL
jgi:hypothetical protein